MQLKDTVFFITGGAQGLGLAYTEALLSNGAKVFFGDVNPTTGEKTLLDLKTRFNADNVKFQKFDVTDHKSFEGAFKQCISEFGHVDVLVNNAGIMNEGLWEHMIKINITAVVYGTKLACEHMRKDKGGRGGRIINISSVAGLVDVFFLSVYCATKHAVRSFTSSLACQPDLKEQGIEYGILCPAAAQTDLVMELDDSKVDYFDKVKGFLTGNAMPTKLVMEAFMELVQLEEMNGAILQVGQEKREYKKMENVVVPRPGDETH